MTKTSYHGGYGVCAEMADQAVLRPEKSLLKGSHTRFYKGTPGRTVLGGLFQGGIRNAGLLKRCTASVFQVSACLWTARRRVVFGKAKVVHAVDMPTEAESA